MGPQSSVETMTRCAVGAERLGFESLWITDHIAIPPDDAEGSGGRYLDTLTTLAYLGGVTRTIRLGSGVIILPYRPPLPTAKQVATVQELTGGRLLLGVGIGWMDAEFRALGVDRHQRGRISDETLDYLNRCFTEEVMEANGQPFLFRPCPDKPPVYVGGSAPHALLRAARYGDGWLPMALEPDPLGEAMVEYRRITEELDRPAGQVTLMRGLPLGKPDATRALLEQYQGLGLDRLVCALGYDDADAYLHQLEQLAELIDSK
ncbi:MAG TPA: TIGR03619 family F420-dependent LLM class oxidoreductase [Pseudomonadales bacterium]